MCSLINFPISAIIFGICANNLWREVETSGWVLSARCVWFSCLVVSTFTFLILQLDPSATLGIFHPTWRAFVAFFDTSLVINTVHATLYMYLIVLSKRHLQQVPRLHTYLWIGVNIVSTVFIVTVSLVGAITDNHFWFAIGLVGLVTQELFLLVANNVNLFRVSQLFIELEATTHVSYSVQRRKLLILRVVFNVLAVTTIVASLLVKNAGLEALWSPEKIPVISYDPETFDIFYLMPDWLTISTHMMLMYAMRKPAASKSSAGAVVNLSLGSASSDSLGAAARDSEVVVLATASSPSAPKT